MKSKKRAIAVILVLVVIIVVVIAVVCVLRHKNAVEESASTSEPVTEAVVSDVEEEPQPEEPQLSSVTIKNPVDFDSIWQQEEDGYAYLYVEDTNIDYPVYQHPEDDSYYLTHNADGSEGYPGCLYTEKANAKDFTDFMTVIYGHNMKNGSMFRTLHEFEDSSFFEEHPYVYIYLPEEILIYEVYAAYEFSDAHILNTYPFETAAERTDYLSMVEDIGNGFFREEAKPDEEDCILTMSTCTSDSDKRLLVQSKLIDRVACTYQQEVTIEVEPDEVEAYQHGKM